MRNIVHIQKGMDFNDRVVALSGTLVLVITLPLLLFALTTRQYSLKTKAASGEPVPPVSGAFGKAASFDGSTAYISLNNSGTLNSNYGFTIETWLRVPEITTSAMSVFNKHIPAIYNYSPELLVSNSVNQDGSYRVAYHFSVANGTYCLNTTTSYTETIPKDSFSIVTSWKHVAAVIQNDGRSELFINGQKKGASTSIASPCNGGGSGAVGARLGGDGSTLYGQYKGEMDELRISNIVRYDSDFSIPTTPFASDANTILLYHFDGNLVNSASQDYHGLPHGGFTYVESTVPSQNYSLQFDGRDFAKSVDLPLLSEFTVEAWVKRVKDTGDYEAFLSDANANYSQAMLTLFIDGGNKDCDQDEFAYYQVNGDDTQCSGIVADLGNWHHVAVVREASGIRRIFIDGNMVSEALNSSSPTNSNTQLHLGRAGRFNSEYFQGYVDDVRISKVARYNADFVAVRNSLETDTNTLLLYKFNEGSGQAVADLSGNGNNAVLGNTNGVERADPQWSLE